MHIDRLPAFAHRGLHGAGARENSIEAFERACRAGCGIEMDLRLSRDGIVVVSHDADLARLFGRAARVDSLTAAELREVGIPSFDEALECVRGRVPLLIELKRGRGQGRLVRLVAARLRAYEGEALTESFDPRILLSLRRRCPDRPRGQLVCARSRTALWFMRPALTVCRGLAKPDFLAIELSARDRVVAACGRMRTLPRLVWTVTDEDAYRAGLARGEASVFEGFEPPDTPI